MITTLNMGRHTPCLIYSTKPINCSICSSRSCGATARSTSGTGLGLAIVQCIIDAYAGKLKISRSARQGLRIRAYLPLPVASVDQSARVSKAKAAGKSAE